MDLGNYGLQKTWLDIFLKSPVSKETLTSNMVNGPNDCCHLNGSTVTLFSDHLEGNWVGKKSLLVSCKTLKEFVNTLTADDKYSLLNRDKLMEPNQTQLSQKQKAFSPFFFWIFERSIKFETVSEQRWSSLLMYFGNYGLRKTWLDICLKSLNSKDPLTGNMINRPRHCCEMKGSTVLLFSDHFEGNWVGKSPF